MRGHGAVKEEKKLQGKKEEEIVTGRTHRVNMGGKVGGDELKTNNAKSSVYTPVFRPQTTRTSPGI